MLTILSCRALLIALLVMIPLLVQLRHRQRAVVNAFANVPKQCAANMFQEHREKYLSFLDTSKSLSKVAPPPTNTERRYLCTECTVSDWQFLGNITLRVLCLVLLIVLSGVVLALSRAFLFLFFYFIPSQLMPLRAVP